VLIPVCKPSHTELISAAFEPLVKATGASVDELKLITSFLLSYPLAALLKRIPDTKPWQKSVFIIAVSLFYLVGLFDLWGGIRTIMYSAAGTYAIAYYIDGSLMPWIGFVFLMGHMSINHLQRQFTNNPSAVDITGAQMVLIMKLSAFCWNVHDGRLEQEGLTEYQRDRAIIGMPNFLEYAGYVLFFPSLMAGPAFDFNDYKRWLETSMFDLPPDMDPSKAPPTRKKRKIPRSGRPAAWKAVYGLGWIFLFIKFSSWYSVELALSDRFMRYFLVRRIWHVYVMGFTARLKYYGVWSLTEGACILSGMGYNGIDPRTGKAKWNRLENVSPYSLETAQNSRSYLDSWNKNTNVWLRNYVYLRVTPKGKKPGFRASLATFATSAFWHGFYPGYYLTFTLGAFIQTVAKNFRRYVRPFFMSPDGKSSTPNKKYYDFLSYIATQLFFSFTVAPFVILRFSDSIRLWSRVYFYGIIGVAVSLGFFASPAKQYLIKQINKRNHPRVQRTASQETVGQPTLGLPSDPGRDIDEALQEIKKEVDTRKRRGSKVSMPTGQDLKAAVEGKLGRKLN
jgi:lysophospholipid acyltransferase